MFTRFFTIIFLLFFIFQNPLLSNIKLFSSLDEITALIFPLIAVLAFISRREFEFRKYTITTLLFLLFIFIIGFVGNEKFDYQLPLYALIDFFTIIKFALIYLSARYFFQKVNVDQILISLNTFARLSSFLLFLLACMNYLFKFFPIYEVRYGIEAQQLFYSHPTFLVSSAVLLIAILLVNLDKSKNIPFIFLLGIVIFSTLRTKAIVFVVIIYLLYYFILKFNKKIKYRHIFLISLLSAFAGYKLMFEELFIYEYYPRTILTKVSLLVANNHFPFGSGFGTYGSFMSGLHYSKLYYNLGFNNYYAMSPTNFNAITDVYWPMLFAQLGYFGIVLFIVLMFRLFKDTWKLRTTHKYLFISSISIWIYLGIASTSESSFSNYYATGYFLFVGMLVAHSLKNKPD